MGDHCKTLPSLSSKISRVERAMKAHLRPGRWMVSHSPRKGWVPESPVFRPYLPPTVLTLWALLWLSIRVDGKVTLPGSCAHQRVGTEAHLARDLAPVAPRMAGCLLPHCVPGLACRLQLASLLPSACIRPGRGHGLPGFPHGPGGGFWHAYIRTPHSAPLRRGPQC